MFSFAFARFGIGLGAAWVLLSLGGCGGKAVRASDPEPSAETPAAAEAPAVESGPSPEVVDGREEPLSAAREEVSQLRQALAERSAEVMALEEAKATLELELKSALEELVRTQASVRNVQSRAFAVSRISEVRVELQSFQKLRDPAIADRVERAAGFLDHADRALQADNVGGAAYLAERASELLRQVRTMAEVREAGPMELLPLVPPRMLEVVAPANLRKGPGSDSERVGQVEPGTRLKAIARHGDWYQVELEGKSPLWIHRRLVR